MHEIDIGECGKWGWTTIRWDRFWVFFFQLLANFFSKLDTAGCTIAEGIDFKVAAEFLCLEFGNVNHKWGADKWS